MAVNPTTSQKKTKIVTQGNGTGAQPEEILIPPTFADRPSIIFLGVYLTTILATCIYLLLKLWPTVVPIADDPEVTMWLGQETLAIIGGPIIFSDSVRVLLIALTAGAIGSLVHTIRSFVDFAGNRQLVTSWIPWYMLRPISGAAMALVFYLVIGDKLLGAELGEAGFSIGGVAALAALVGLFSEQASEKLKEVFSTLLSTKEAPKTLDRLRPLASNPVPVADALAPNSASVGTGKLSISIAGKHFVEGAEARLDGQPRSTEFKNDTEVILVLTAEDVRAPRKKTVTVVNPPPGGGETDPLELEITP